MNRLCKFITVCDELPPVGKSLIALIALGALGVFMLLVDTGLFSMIDDPMMCVISAFVYLILLRLGLRRVQVSRWYSKHESQRLKPLSVEKVQLVQIIQVVFRSFQYLKDWGLRPIQMIYHQEL